MNIRRGATGDIPMEYKQTKIDNSCHRSEYLTRQSRSCILVVVPNGVSTSVEAANHPASYLYHLMIKRKESRMKDRRQRLGCHGYFYDLLSAAAFHNIGTESNRDLPNEDGAACTTKIKRMRQIVNHNLRMPVDRSGADNERGAVEPPIHIASNLTQQLSPLQRTQRVDMFRRCAGFLTNFGLSELTNNNAWRSLNCTGRAPEDTISRSFSTFYERDVFFIFSQSFLC
ncbi:uncharacterized protein LOC124411415 [Diprion similis]|uniref:uncharacterized protein LOC124411415 n=1 Tax=Diprion similis TaxID=362088 RepID=UPI001EF93033|nr:uncharacterized protein LOC124411415 [Diprion similis]